jgi:DNA-binding response OmpR family regulator
MMPTVRTACRRFTDDFGLTKTLRLSRLRAREAGMVCCLAKPFAPDELLECVREALARATPKS